MTIRAFDDAGTAFDQSNINLDGCLLADFDDPTAAFDEPLVAFDGCDSRTVTPPATTSGSFRQYRTFRPDELAREPDDEEAILVLLLALV